MLISTENALTLSKKTHNFIITSGYLSILRTYFKAQTTKAKKEPDTQNQNTHKRLTLFCLMNMDMKWSMIDLTLKNHLNRKQRQTTHGHHTRAMHEALQLVYIHKMEFQSGLTDAT